MITLDAVDLKWVTGESDDPNDQCAHGLCDFSVGDTVFFSRDDEEITVSAAALFLLRTLQHDHQPDKRITGTNFLFPCCGNSVWLVEDKFPVDVAGCHLGKDIWLKHTGNEVELESDRGKAIVKFADWERSVANFSDQVLDFYKSSSKKVVVKDKYDRKAWRAFWAEFYSRREAVKLT